MMNQLITLRYVYMLFSLNLIETSSDDFIWHHLFQFSSSHFFRSWCFNILFHFLFSLSISQSDIQNICLSHLLLIIYFLLSSGNLHGARNCYVILWLYPELLESNY